MTAHEEHAETLLRLILKEVRAMNAAITGVVNDMAALKTDVAALGTAIEANPPLGADDTAALAQLATDLQAMDATVKGLIPTA